MSTLLWLLAVVFILVGIAGTVIPAIPGTSLVFLGLLLAAWADNFVKVGWVALTVLALMTLGSFGIDFYTTSLGAKKVGASKMAIVGAAVGTVIGIFFGFVGLIVGPFAGAFLGELLVRKDLKQAGKAGAGTWLGIAIGMAAKIALVFAMIGIFVLSYII